MADLHAAAQNNKGVIIRYCTYLLSPDLTHTQLAERYAAGETPSNPARGRVIGTIGIWAESDYESVPNGRLLLPVQPLNWNHGTVLFGPATVSVALGRGKVLVDLVTAVPENDANGSKINAGPAELLAVPDGGGTPVKLGSIPYSKSPYEDAGGTAEIDLDEAQQSTLETASLALSFNGISVLEEKRLTVDTDHRNLYLDAGDRREIVLKVQDREAFQLTSGHHRSAVPQSCWQVSHSGSKHGSPPHPSRPGPD